MIKLLALTLALSLTVSGLSALGEAAEAVQADFIFRNAKIFTSDEANPQATALVVKDGRFVYVGDEAGLSAYAPFSIRRLPDLVGKGVTAQSSRIP